MFCLLILGALFATVVRNESCTKALRNVIRGPNQCAENYFERISKELRIQSPLLFTIDAPSIISNFENKYKVQVELRSAFNSFSPQEECFRVEANQVPLDIEEFTYLGLTFDTSNLPATPLTSYVLEAFANNFTSHFHMNAYLYSDGGFRASTIMFQDCLDEPSMNVTFSDSATLEMSHGSCPGFSTGALYKSITPLSNVFAGKNANDVFTAEVSADYNFDNGILQSFALILCTKPDKTFGFDMARPVTNYPAFSLDPQTGMYSYSFVIRNAVGQMQYVIIQKSVSEIKC